MLWLLDLLPRSDSSSASLQVQWSRTGSNLTSTTSIPLPHFESLHNKLEHYALVSYPQSTRLYQPTLFQYSITNSHATTPLQLSITVESSPDWVLSSPRKINRLVVLPNFSHTLSISAIPVSRIGPLDIPRVRVFQLLKPDILLEEAAEGTLKTRELPVLPEGLLWSHEMDVFDEEGNVKRLAAINVLP